MKPLEMFPEHGFMGGHTFDNATSLDACGHPAAVANQSQVSCKRFCSGLQDDPTRDVPRARCHGRTNATQHHFSGRLRGSDWSGKSNTRARFCSALQDDSTRDVTRARFHGKTHTRRRHFSVRLRASDWSGKSDTRARYLASGSVQASRTNPLLDEPRARFHGRTHTRRHHFSGPVAGIRLECGNQTLEPGIVQAILVRRPG